MDSEAYAQAFMRLDRINEKTRRTIRLFDRMGEMTDEFGRLVGEVGKVTRELNHRLPPTRARNRQPPIASP
jgi:hypothetical protein